ncbi:MAG: nucleoside monophosphate kinase [Puniceicoccales bacterium]|jgi:adenylate kinase|nr:nucleoside monophosphate kinase [Puniceicoccales bacterium]
MDPGRAQKIFTMAVVALLCIGDVTAVPNADGLQSANRMAEKVAIVKNMESKDIEAASFLLNDVWQKLYEKCGQKNMVFPRQIVFLNGAPGAGKGTNTATVMRVLEIPTRPVEVSSLLNTPECEKLKESGMLVGDEIVIKQLFCELLKPENFRGIIIDGFPRTTVQAHFLRLLIRKLNEDWSEQMPIFRMINFSVSQRTSINRQLSRGVAAIEQSKKTPADGGKLVTVRPTDLSAEAAARRYKIYEESIGACIMILRDCLEFYEIDAEGTLEEVKHRAQNMLSQ